MQQGVLFPGRTTVASTQEDLLSAFDFSFFFFPGTTLCSGRSKTGPFCCWIDRDKEEKEVVHHELNLEVLNPWVGSWLGTSGSHKFGGGGAFPPPLLRPSKVLFPDARGTTRTARQCGAREGTVNSPYTRQDF